jgi:hypothetical protein
VKNVTTDAIVRTRTGISKIDRKAVMSILAEISVAVEVLDVVVAAAASVEAVVPPVVGEEPLLDLLEKEVLLLLELDLLYGNGNSIDSLALTKVE